jgi:hypothetical protein
MSENSITNEEIYGLDAFTLKIIAIFCMTLNHVWHVFGEFLPVSMTVLFCYAGGFTFPIMAFLLAQGYARTSSVNKYMVRLLVCGAIAAFPFMLTVGDYTLDTIFTLLLGLAVLKLNDRIKNRKLFFLCLAAAMGVSYFFDWPVVGVLMIYLFATLKNRTLRVLAPLLLGTAFYMAWEWIAVGSPIISLQGMTLGAIYNFGIISAAPLLLAYNGGRGSRMKHFFYAYYPAHLIILTLLFKLIAPA